MNKKFPTYLKEAKDLLASNISPSYKNWPQTVEHLSPVLSNLEQALYVYDLANSKISYMSDNALDIYGYSSEEITKNSPEAFMDLWHEDDMNIIFNNVFPEGLEAIKKIKDYDITRHRITFSYRLRQKDGTYKTCLNQFSHVLEDENRNPLVIMGTASDVTSIYNKPELFCRVSNKNKKGKWEIIYERYFSYEESKKDDFGLTPKEFEIIKFVYNGLSSKEIGYVTNRSKETIKSQRKSIVSKTNCNNMSEVIVLAIKNGWV